ncbi:MAG: ion transporter [Myxococcota bacterium]
MSSPLYDAFHRPSSSIYARVETLVWVLVLLSLVLLGLEPFLSGSQLRALEAVDTAVLVLFAIELGLRVATFRPPTLSVFERTGAEVFSTHLVARLRYLLQPMQLIDLITVVALVPALRGLRVLRLLRLLKSKRLFRYGNPFSGLTHGFEADRGLFLFAFSALGGQTLLGGITLFLVERGAEGASVESLGDGIWLALVTLTTVGFGDYSPVTDVGRVVAGTLMVGGMFTLALFAGIVGHTLLNAVLSIREEQFRMSAYCNHVIICGYRTGSDLLLDAISEEFDVDETRVVLFGPGARPPDVPPAFLWVQGEPSKESELDKVRLGYASSVIVVANRSVTPQMADATTILTAFTMRAYLARRDFGARRKRPLRIVAEILEPENVAHARAGGADEVIETTRIGYSLLSHSLLFPGVGDLTGHVVAYGDHNLYTGRLAEELHDETFGDVAARTRSETGALVVGWRDPGDGAEHINPPDESCVPGHAELIYLAAEPKLPIP